MTTLYSTLLTPIIVDAFPVPCLKLLSTFQVSLHPFTDPVERSDLQLRLYKMSDFHLRLYKIYIYKIPVSPATAT